MTLIRCRLFSSVHKHEGMRIEHSDIDLLIVFEKLADKDKRKTAVDIRVALADLPVAKDIVVTTPEELEHHRTRIGSVLRYAQQEGKILYANN